MHPSRSTIKPKLAYCHRYNGIAIGEAIYANGTPQACRRSLELLAPSTGRLLILHEKNVKKFCQPTS